MSDKFWVGGTANWDGTAGSKWATTSGGGGGSAIPTTSDDVFFDANSGANTVTLASGHTNCKSLSFSGFTGTFTGATNISIAGSLALVSAMTYSLGVAGIAVVTFTSTGPETITSAGKTFEHATVFDGVGGTWTLQDNLTSTTANNRSIQLNNGTFNTNNKNVICRNLLGSGTASKSFILGSSTITVSGGTTNSFNTNQTGTTLSSGTSKIILSGATTMRISAASGHVFYDVECAGTNATTSVEFYTSNTFHNITSTVSPQVINVLSGVTLTVNDFLVRGTAGNLVTFKSVTSGTPFTISKSSGIVAVNYLSIKDSVATGGATFYAGANSTNVSGNTGWTFTGAVFPITMAVGTYSWTGQNVLLVKTSKILMAVGAYLYTGRAISLVKLSKILMSVGSYIYTGNTVLISRVYIILMSAGVYIYTGNLISLIYRAFRLPNFIDSSRRNRSRVNELIPKNKRWANSRKGDRKS